MNKILRWICIIGLFLLPFLSLVIANSMFFPFITGKNFGFRIIVEIIFAAWVILAVTDSAYRPRKSWLAWASIGFVGIMLIADIFSANPYKSFFSNFERMEGFVTLIHLFAFGIIAATVMGRDLWDRFFQTWIGVSLVMVMYSFFQLLGLLRINQGGVRIDATLGNAAYLSIFSLFTAFLLLFFIVRRKGTFNAHKNVFIAYGFNLGFIIFAIVSKAEIMDATLVGKLVGFSFLAFVIANALFVLSALYEDGRYLYGLIFIGELVIIYNTQTRGTMLGLIAGLGLAGLLIAIFEKNNQTLKKTSIGVVIAAVVLVLGFVAIKNAPFVKNSPTLSRFSSISLNDPTTESRFILWGMAWKGVTSSPKTFIIGWGQESFNYVFNKYYDPRLYNQEQWFDRSHDIFFDWFVAGGLLGLLGYLSIFGGTIFYIWKPIAKGEAEDNTFSVGEKSLLTGMLVGYFIHNIFVFDNITSYLFYVSFVAYVYARRTQFATARETKVVENRFVAPVALVALVLVIYFVNVPALLANASLIQAISNQSDVAGTIKAFQKTLSYNSFGSAEAREQIYTYADQVTNQLSQTQDQTQLATIKGYQAQVLALVDTESQKQIAATPNDARYYILPGAIYNHAAEYDKALPLLQKAATLSPNKQSILFELASAYLASGNSQKAEDTLKTAYQADTADIDARLLYATGAIYNKDQATATALLKGVPQEQVASNDALLQAYYYSGQYQTLVDLWKVRVSNDPQNTQYIVSLAAAYLLIKDNKDAILEIQKAEQITPSFKAQGDQYIQQINSGQM